MKLVLVLPVHLLRKCMIFHYFYVLTHNQGKEYANKLLVDRKLQTRHKKSLFSCVVFGMFSISIEMDLRITLVCP